MLQGWPCEQCKNLCVVPVLSYYCWLCPLQLFPGLQKQHNKLLIYGDEYDDDYDDDTDNKNKYNNNNNENNNNDTKTMTTLNDKEKEDKLS